MTDEVIDQAPEQSIEQKLAARFGGGEPEPQVEAEPVDDGTADIEWDGLTFRAPIKVKEALMRNEDYTKKTQELAEQRRLYEQTSQLAQQRQMEGAFHESTAQETQELSVIDAYLQQVSKLDWSAMNTDQIVRQKLELDNIKERRQAIRESIEGKRAKFNEDVKARLSELRGKSRELASKSIQGFSEDTEKAMRSFALGEGLTESEIDNVFLDPRSFKVVYKAMQFDAVQKGTGKAAEAAKQADRVLRPGAASNKMPDNVRAKLDYGKAMKNAKTSGEKANVIESRIAGMFGGR